MHSFAYWAVEDSEEAVGRGSTVQGVLGTEPGSATDLTPPCEAHFLLWVSVPLSLVGEFGEVPFKARLGGRSGPEHSPKGSWSRQETDSFYCYYYIITFTITITLLLPRASSLRVKTGVYSEWLGTSVKVMPAGTWHCVWFSHLLPTLSHLCAWAHSFPVPLTLHLLNFTFRHSLSSSYKLN